MLGMNHKTNTVKIMPLSLDFVSELNKNLRGAVRTDRASRVLYSTDASIYQVEPLGVVIPRDQDDLQAAVEIAARHKVPVLPRGSGSSLAGQAVGPAMILDCSRWLDHILEINPEERTATVEPGVILTTLNKSLARHGLQFGPDPASAERATLGGVIANNATGAHSIIHGMTADHLLEAEAILSDGSLAKWGQLAASERNDFMRAGGRMGALVASIVEIREKYADAIRRSYPMSWRNSAGYRLNYLLPWSASRPPQWGAAPYPPSRPDSINLASLLAGSEGTLAIIRSARLNLVPRPAQTILAVVAYADIAGACDDVPRLLECRPSAIELIPQSIVRLAQSIPAYSAQASILDLGAEALLVVEFSGNSLQQLRALADSLHPSLVAELPQDQKRIWDIRKMGLGLLASRTGDSKTTAFIEDCAIPPEQLGEFVRGVQKVLRQYQTEAEFYAHASAGCLHIRPILNLKRQKRELRQIAWEVLLLTLALGGSMSSEHGDGLARSEWLQQTYGDEVLSAFRLLKQSADPDCLMNPGKILDAPPMDSNLRFGEGYAARPWRSKLDLNEAGGLESAIEQCNGQGVCRKFDGTMCPSFQATREEMNSTRGRANLLRALISSPAPSALEKEIYQALDLCLACKGCKSECPSGVDMARLKFEFMAHYFRKRPRPLRDYIFGYFHTASALISPMAPLVNAVMRFSPVRNLIASMTGMTAHRPFPVFATKRAHPVKPAGPAPHEKVLFLSDAFTHFIEPQIEQAAFNLLAADNCEVIVLPVVGAGASLLSKSFIDPARQHARRLMDAIAGADPEGTMQIVGLEPPDIYCLKNDFGMLLPARRDEIASISRRTWLFEEFLIRSKGITDLRIVINGTRTRMEKSKKIKFQPHCHQRAETMADDGLPSGSEATLSLLKQCGFDAELIEAGCCGMAGTFGYEREHYELSVQVGELRLFPSIRNSLKQDPQMIFLSTGSACRMQIEQGTSASVEHPVVFLARHLS